jgi:methionyl aminopeptidase
MSVDTPEQMEGLERAGRVVATTLRSLRRAVAPGVTTGNLDELAGEMFAAHGARSGPILTYGYPGSICVSVDDEVVHGIPGSRVLQRGQLVSLDVAAEVDGFHADAAVTVPVGPVDRREHENASLGMLAADRDCRPQAVVGVVGRHLHVDHGHVWMVRSNLALKLHGVRALSDDLESG